MTFTLPAVPTGGFTIDEFEALDSQLPHYVELIDGQLVVNFARTSWESWAIHRLIESLAAQAPTVMVLSEVGIRVGKKSRPEPDVLVVRREAADLDAASYEPADVVLAVEVLSPESTDRDRNSKPVLYAQAGIQYFWRVEREERTITVYTYELDPMTKSYSPTGIHHKKLVVDLPWPITCDLESLIF